MIILAYRLADAGAIVITAPNCFAVASGSFAVTQGSLVSVQLTTSQGIGALNDGAAVTIFLTTP